MTTSILKIKNCFYEVNGETIIDNLSGEIKKDKITSFIGPSGAGKSTLFRLFNQLLSHQKGSIELDGTNIKTIDPIECRQRVGIVLQDAVMIPGTVYDNLKLPSDLRKTTFTQTEAKILLQKVGLEEKYLLHPAKELSGGQKQKVSIARTLANKPEVLLLDELTASLDQVSTRAIEQLIVTLNKTERITILMISHDVKQALSMSDAIWVLIDGQKRYSGPPEELKNCKDAKVQAFLAGGGSH